MDHGISEAGFKKIPLTPKGEIPSVLLPVGSAGSTSRLHEARPRRQSHTTDPTDQSILSLSLGSGSGSVGKSKGSQATSSRRHDSSNSAGPSNSHHGLQDSANIPDRDSGAKNASDFDDPTRDGEKKYQSGRRRFSKGTSPIVDPPNKPRVSLEDAKREADRIRNQQEVEYHRAMEAWEAQMRVSAYPGPPVQLERSMNPRKNGGGTRIMDTAKVSRRDRGHESQSQSRRTSETHRPDSQQDEEMDTNTEQVGVEGEREAPNLDDVMVQDEPIEQNGAQEGAGEQVVTTIKPVKKQKKASAKKAENYLTYTTAFVPGLQNIKNPAGNYVQHDSNVDVFRQISQNRLKAEKFAMEEAARQAIEAGERPVEVPSPLSQTLIIHPGSRHLRIGRASDFYPKEIPNCIARRGDAVNRGSDPPVPGSRAQRLAAEQKAAREAGKHQSEDVDMNGDEGEEIEWVDPVDTKIGLLRDYLRQKLRANRLSTDYREGSRVTAYNSRVKPEPIPEHNDPYRIDWTEVQDKTYFIGEEALKLPDSSGFKVRYPILHRSLNTRDWKTLQMLIDDIALILGDSLSGELDITPSQYHTFSVVLIVPDHGDRMYVQEMTNLLLGVMGFKEIAVHQEAYTAIFSAAMSSACVVDIGAQSTSITFVDEGTVIPDTRMMLKYGGDDITATLVALLQRSSFPYRELDLARTQDWDLMDKLKIKICTLEEHLVASTAWDFYALKENGLTNKYLMRTYDENILAPLCFFDTRLIDFEEKEGSGPSLQRKDSEDIDDLLISTYNDATNAMRACTTHLLPATNKPIGGDAEGANPDEPMGNGESATAANGDEKAEEKADSVKPTIESTTNGSADNKAINVFTEGGNEAESTSRAASPAAEPTSVPMEESLSLSWSEIVEEASRSPLDGAIAAAISVAGNENKVKVAANSILLIGGSSSLKGLPAFLQERLPPLLRAKGILVDHVTIVPPPRNLNPKFVSWKGAAVMCNLESLSDMWIRRDEWEAIGARSLKDRYLFF